MITASRRHQDNYLVGGDERDIPRTRSTADEFSEASLSNPIASRYRQKGRASNGPILNPTRSFIECLNAVLVEGSRDREMRDADEMRAADGWHVRIQYHVMIS